VLPAFSGDDLARKSQEEIQAMMGPSEHLPRPQLGGDSAIFAGGAPAASVPSSLQHIWAGTGGAPPPAGSPARTWGSGSGGLSSGNAFSPPQAGPGAQFPLPQQQQWAHAQAAAAEDVGLGDADVLSMLMRPQPRSPQQPSFRPQPGSVPLSPSLQQHQGQEPRGGGGSSAAGPAESEDTLQYGLAASEGSSEEVDPDTGERFLHPRHTSSSSEAAWPPHPDPPQPPPAPPRSQGVRRMPCPLAALLEQNTGSALQRLCMRGGGCLPCPAELARAA
jgi:hypothetical protein